VLPAAAPQAHWTRKEEMVGRRKKRASKMGKRPAKPGQTEKPPGGVSTKRGTRGHRQRDWRRSMAGMPFTTLAKRSQQPLAIWVLVSLNKFYAEL
jgi:hypothetical protein